MILRLLRQLFFIAKFFKVIFSNSSHFDEKFLVLFDYPFGASKRFSRCPYYYEFPALYKKFCFPEE